MKFRTDEEPNEMSEAHYSTDDIGSTAQREKICVPTSFTGVTNSPCPDGMFSLVTILP